MFLNIVWDFDPVAFSFLGREVRWYGIMFATAFACSYWLTFWMMKKEKNNVLIADTLLLYIAIGTIIGARLGHCFFYEPAHYLANPLEVLKIWRGGLASHGGAFGILIAIYLAARKHNQSYWYLVDRVVICVAMVGFFVRTGNLFNSEIYGHETTLPWGFIFVRNGETVPMHPTQIYEALAYLAISGILLSYYIWKKHKPKDGYLFGAFLILVFGARIAIESIKNPQVDFERYMSLNMGQWLSIPFVLGGIVILWLAVNGKLPTFPKPKFIQKKGRK